MAEIEWKLKAIHAQLDVFETLELPYESFNSTDFLNILIGIEEIKRKYMKTHQTQISSDKISREIMKCSVNNEDIKLCFVIIVTDKLVNGDVSKLPVFVIKSRNRNIFIDLNCTVFKSWEAYLKTNDLPACMFCFPVDGQYMEGERLKIDFASSVDTLKNWKPFLWKSLACVGVAVIASSFFSSTIPINHCFIDKLLEIADIYVPEISEVLKLILNGVRIIHKYRFGNTNLLGLLCELCSLLRKVNEKYGEDIKLIFKRVRESLSNLHDWIEQKFSDFFGSASEESQHEFLAVTCKVDAEINNIDFDIESKYTCAEHQMASACTVREPEMCTLMFGATVSPDSGYTEKACKETLEASRKNNTQDIVEFQMAAAEHMPLRFRFPKSGHTMKACKEPLEASRRNKTQMATEDMSLRFAFPESGPTMTEPLEALRRNNTQDIIEPQMAAAEHMPLMFGFPESEHTMKACKEPLEASRRNKTQMATEHMSRRFAFPQSGPTMTEPLEALRRNNRNSQEIFEEVELGMAKYCESAYTETFGNDQLEHAKQREIVNIDSKRINQTTMDLLDISNGLAKELGKNTLKDVQDIFEALGIIFLEEYREKIKVYTKGMGAAKEAAKHDLNMPAYNQSLGIIGHPKQHVQREAIRSIKELKLSYRVQLKMKELKTQKKVLLFELGKTSEGDVAGVYRCVGISGAGLITVDALVVAVKEKGIVLDEDMLVVNEALLMITIRNEYFFIALYQELNAEDTSHGILLIDRMV